MVSTDKEKPALLRVFFFSELAFVLPPQVGGFARQGDFDAQPGLVVVQLQAAVVQGDDGAHQRESQPVAGGAAGAVQADEAFQDVVAFVRRDAVAVVADADVDVFAALFGGEGNVTAARCVFDGVVEQVGDGLGDELAVAHDVQPAFDVRCKAVFAFFGHDVVEFGEVVADGAQAFVFEVVFGAAFDLRDV